MYLCTLYFYFSNSRAGLAKKNKNGILISPLTCTHRNIAAIQNRIGTIVNFEKKKKLNIYELLIRDREMDRNAIEKFYWL